MAKLILPPVYFVSVSDDFEAEGFFDANFEYITGWHGNDAHWRGEYMDSVIQHFGRDVVYYQNIPAAKYKKMQKILKERFGG